MDEAEVLQIMHYPYKKQVLENGESVYHIWFYVTRPSGLPQSRLVRQNMTPLTFQNGVLQGWGFAYYDYILRPKEASQEKPSKADQKSLEHVIEGIEQNPKTSKNQTDSPETKKGDKKGKKKEGKKPKEDDQRLNDEDRKMIQEENEQNFDFW